MTAAGLAVTVAADLAAERFNVTLEPVRMRLHEAADRFMADCVLESCDGAVIGHALRSAIPSTPVVQAVLHSHAAPLHAGLVARRTTAVLTHGAVQQGRIAGVTTVVVPVTAAGETLAWLWVVGHRPASDLELDLERVAGLLADEISAGHAIQDSHFAGIIAGRVPLPISLADASEVQIMALLPPHGISLPVLATVVRGAFRLPGLRTSPPLVGCSGRVVQIVLRIPDDRIGHVAGVVLEHVNAVLGAPATAGVASGPPDPAALRIACVQAEAVAAANSDGGTCRTLPQLRSALVLDRACEALGDVADFGPDPLQRLLDHDARRHTDYARTLLVWLDAHGDFVAAADALPVHYNTLRYRVARAEKILAVSLSDPCVRLELHLRLRRLVRDKRQ